MNISRRTLSFGAKTSLALLGLACISAQSAHAQAQSFSFSINGFSFTKPGGSDFTVDPNTATVTLTPNSGKVFTLQSVVFDANQDDNFGQTPNQAHNQTMTLGGVTENISRSFYINDDIPSDSSMLANDTLYFYTNSSPTIFNLGSKGTVTVTPYSYSDPNEDVGTYSGNLVAKFLYTPAAAPEPSQAAALSIGLLGLGALGLRARSKRLQA